MPKPLSKAAEKFNLMTDLPKIPAEYAAKDGDFWFGADPWMGLFVDMEPFSKTADNQQYHDEVIAQLSCTPPAVRY